MLVVAIFGLFAALGMGGFYYSTKKLSAVNRRRKEWEAADAFVLSAGAGGVSMAKLYLASKNHDEALANLQDIYSKVIPEDASPMEWATYFEGKVHKGEQSVQGIVNAWKGALAEQQLVDGLNADPLLHEHGLTAHRYDSPNHPDTDFYYTDADGQVLPHDEVESLGLPEQVKNYSPDNVHNFLAEVNDNPDAVYAVNHELYETLSESGRLDTLDANIVDGGYSSVALQAQAEDVIGDFHDGLDISEDIPFVAMAVFGVKTVNNLKSFASGQLTVSEAAVNVGGDAVRISVGRIAAVGGAKAGALVGSMIMPGVGTLVGGIAGALGGALGIGKLFNYFKERFKYGEIMDACERIGRGYCHSALGGVRELRTSVENAILSLPQLENMHQREFALAQAYSVPEKVTAETCPTPSQALVLRGVLEIERQVQVMRRAAPMILRKLGGLVHQLDPNREPKRGYGYLGWLVASQSDYLLAETSEYDNDVSIALDQATHFPHHPYRLRQQDGTCIEEGAFLKTVVTESINEADKWTPTQEAFWRSSPVGLWMALLLSALMLLVGGFGAYDLHSGGKYSQAFLEKANTFLFSMPSSEEPDLKIAETPVLVIKVKITAGALNVRAEPNGSAAVVSRLKRNDIVPVIDKAPGWLKIELPSGSMGWVSAKYTEKEGN